ncbi:S4 domain-containing protein [Deinococcus roseus]|uniref:RNA-binding protein n=1 Tax=Deinococcus roseus TaxID=392414 RepID=A0ABQ2D0E3_9DEIO|nr:S4 domain-containing protein [Deinococcus roseus]GGJ35260.1 RNA-binding protein [Deinococcus roseus]
MNLSKLMAQAAGGRVIRTGFIPQDSVSRRELNSPEVKHHISGGFLNAERIVLTLYPEHIPSVSDPVDIWEIGGEFSPHMDAVLLKHQLLDVVPEEQLGDIREHQGTYWVAATGKASAAIEALTSLAGTEVTVEKVDLSQHQRPSKTREVVVPSMRVDVVGAKGFGVSRAYFQAGLENKKVRLNGQVAKSSSEIREGDMLAAEGIGKIEFKRIINETRRGNFKVELLIHRE